MNPYDEMLGLLRRYHTRADGGRLANEMLVVGHNVVTDFIRLKVGLPWIWSPAMGAFYGQTDAFVYEGLGFHYSVGRISMREATAEKIATVLPHGGRVLCYGDGIGFDACEIAARNPEVQVVSFEPGIASSSFARKLIEDRRLAGRVEQVRDRVQLSQHSFDVLVSYDVIEHVPEPENLIKEFATYLKPKSLALIVEAFEAVHPSRPTHLLQNLKFAGKTVSLFKKAGFSFHGLMADRVHIFVPGSFDDQPSLLPIRMKLRFDGARARLRFRYHYRNPDRVNLTDAIAVRSPQFLSFAEPTTARRIQSA